MKMKKLELIGVASGIAGRDVRSGDAPFVLQKSPFLMALSTSGLSITWLDILKAQNYSLEKSQIVVDLCQRLASYTYQLTQKKESFAVIGGDHSCAIGTWSGAAAALAEKNETMGLLWIDAHLDSHTPETTPSGNIHGMPLATLLGHGDPRLTSLSSAAPKLLPQHVAVVGARSYESEELALLKKIGVRIFYMDEINQRGLDSVMFDALTIVRKNTAGYGISLDLDGIDPKEAPAVSVPEPEGIKANDLIVSLKRTASDPHRIGFEIVEFNPALDIDQITEKLIAELLLTLTLPGG